MFKATSNQALAWFICLFVCLFVLFLSTCSLFVSCSCRKIKQAIIFAGRLIAIEPQFGNRLVNFFYLSSDEDLNSRKRGKIKPIDIFAFE